MINIPKDKEGWSDQGWRCPVTDVIVGISLDGTPVSNYWSVSRGEVYHCAESSLEAHKRESP